MLLLVKKFKANLSKLKMNYYHITSYIFPIYVANTVFKMIFTPRRNIPQKSYQTLINQSEKLELLHNGILIRGYYWHGDGELVLFAHGWNSHSLIFRNFICALLKKGFSVIAFDAPGHGVSDGNTFHMLDYVGMIKFLINKYPIKNIIGHSMGSFASLFALSRNNLSIKRLIVIAGFADYGKELNNFLSFITISKRSKRYLVNKIENDFECSFQELDLSYMNGFFNQDGLIIHGEKDTIVPLSQAQKLREIWPNSKLYIVENMGHNGLLKDDKVVETVINYLEFGLNVR